MQKRKKNIALAVSCVILLVFASVCAYTISTESVEGSLTFGRIDISLEENAWHDNDSIVVPDTELPKNPAVKNEGKNDTYVFMKIAVPYSETVGIDYSDTVPDDENVVGHMQGQAVPRPLGTPLPLFKFGVTDSNNVTSYDTSMTTAQLVHDNWVLVEGYPTQEEGIRKFIYVYAYAKQGGTQLERLHSGETTPPVFDKVKLVNFSDTNGTVSGKLSVDADSYGVQTEFLGDLTAENIKEIWELLTSDGGDGT